MLPTNTLAVLTLCTPKHTPLWVITGCNHASAQPTEITIQHKTSIGWTVEALCYQWGQLLLLRCIVPVVFNLSHVTQHTQGRGAESTQVFWQKISEWKQCIWSMFLWGRHCREFLSTHAQPDTTVHHSPYCLCPPRTTLSHLCLTTRHTLLD